MGGFMSHFTLVWFVFSANISGGLSPRISPEVPGVPRTLTGDGRHVRPCTALCMSEGPPPAPLGGGVA